MKIPAILAALAAPCAVAQRGGAFRMRTDDLGLLNGILKDLVIEVDTSTLEATVIDLNGQFPGIGGEATASFGDAAVCRELGVRAINVDGSSLGNTVIDGQELEGYELDLDIQDLQLVCVIEVCLDVNYRIFGVPGNTNDCGTIELTAVQSSDADVLLEQQFYSPDFDSEAVVIARDKDVPCSSKINLDGVDFDGDLVLGGLGFNVFPLLLDQLNGDLKPTATEPISSALCDQLANATGSLNEQILAIGNGPDAGPRDVPALDMALVEEQRLQAAVGPEVDLLVLSESEVIRVFAPDGKNLVVPLREVGLDLIVAIFGFGDELSDPTSPVYQLVDFLLGLDDVGTPGELDLDLLRLARDFVPVPEDGSSPFSFNFTLNNTGAVFLTVNSASLAITGADLPLPEVVFDVASDQTILTPLLGLGDVTLTADLAVRLEVDTVVLDNPLVLVLDETFDLSLGWDGFALQAAVLAAVDLAAQPSINQLLANPIDCALGMLVAPVNFTGAFVNADRLRMTVNGFEEGVAVLLGEFINAVLPVVLSIGPSFLEGLLEDAILALEFLEPAVCPIVDEPEPTPRDIPAIDMALVEEQRVQAAAGPDADLLVLSESEVVRVFAPDGKNLVVPLREIGLDLIVSLFGFGDELDDPTSPVYQAIDFLLGLDDVGTPGELEIDLLRLAGDLLPIPEDGSSPLQFNFTLNNTGSVMLNLNGGTFAITGADAPLPEVVFDIASDQTILSPMLRLGNVSLVADIDLNLDVNTVLMDTPIELSLDENFRLALGWDGFAMQAAVLAAVDLAALPTINQLAANPLDCALSMLAAPVNVTGAFVNADALGLSVTGLDEGLALIVSAVINAFIPILLIYGPAFLEGVLEDTILALEFLEPAECPIVEEPGPRDITALEMALVEEQRVKTEVGPDADLVVLSESEVVRVFAPDGATINVPFSGPSLEALLALLGLEDTLEDPTNPIYQLLDLFVGLTDTSTPGSVSGIDLVRLAAGFLPVPADGGSPLNFTLPLNGTGFAQAAITTGTLSVTGADLPLPGFDFAIASDQTVLSPMLGMGTISIELEIDIKLQAESGILASFPLDERATVSLSWTNFAAQAALLAAVDLAALPTIAELTNSPLDCALSMLAAPVGLTGVFVNIENLEVTVGGIQDSLVALLANLFNAALPIVLPMVPGILEAFAEQSLFGLELVAPAECPAAPGPAPGPRDVSAAEMAQAEEQRAIINATAANVTLAALADYDLIKPLLAEGTTTISVPISETVEEIVLAVLGIDAADTTNPTWRLLNFLVGLDESVPAGQLENLDLVGLLSGYLPVPEDGSPVVRFVQEFEGFGTIDLSLLAGTLTITGADMPLSALDFPLTGDHSVLSPLLNLGNVALSLEAQLKVNVPAGLLPGQSANMTLDETFTVAAGWEDFRLQAAALVAIDADGFPEPEQIVLNALDCLQSILAEPVMISGAFVNAENLSLVTSGFESRLAQILGDLVNALVPIVAEMLPAPLEGFLETMVLGTVLLEDAECPAAPPGNDKDLSAREMALEREAAVREAAGPDADFVVLRSNPLVDLVAPDFSGTLTLPLEGPIFEALLDILGVDLVTDPTAPLAKILTFLLPLDSDATAGQLDLDIAALLDSLIEGGSDMLRIEFSLGAQGSGVIDISNALLSLREAQMPLEALSIEVGDQSLFFPELGLGNLRVTADVMVKVEVAAGTLPGQLPFELDETFQASFAWDGLALGTAALVALDAAELPELARLLAEPVGCLTSLLAEPAGISGARFDGVDLSLRLSGFQDPLLEYLGDLVNSLVPLVLDMASGSATDIVEGLLLSLEFLQPGECPTLNLPVPGVDNRTATDQALAVERDMVMVLEDGVRLVKLHDNAIINLLSSVVEDGAITIPLRGALLDALLSLVGVDLDGETTPLVRLIDALLGLEIDETAGEVTDLDVLALLDQLIPDVGIEEWLQFNTTVLDIGHIKVGLDGARLSMTGAEAIEAIVIRFVGDHSLLAPPLNLGDLQIDADLTLDVQLATASLFGSDIVLDETITLSLGWRGFALELAALIAMDSDLLDDLQLGPLMRTALDCALSVLHEPLQVSGVDLGVTQITFEASGMESEFGIALQQIVNDLGSSFLSDAPRMVTGYAQQFLADQGQLEGGDCAPVVLDESTAQPFADLPDLMGLISGFVNAETINSLIAQYVPDTLTDLRVPVVEKAMELFRAKLPGPWEQPWQGIALSLTTVDLLVKMPPEMADLRLLEVNEANQYYPRGIDNSLTVGSAGSKSFGVDVVLTLEAFPDAPDERPPDDEDEDSDRRLLQDEPEFTPPLEQANSIKLVLTMDSMSAALELFMAYTIYDVESTTMGSLLSLDCWMAKLNPYGGIKSIGLDIDGIAVDLACVDCPNEILAGVMDMLPIDDINKYGARFMDSALAWAVPQLTGPITGLFEREHFAITLQAAKDRCAGKTVPLDSWLLPWEFDDFNATEILGLDFNITDVLMNPGDVNEVPQDLSAAYSFLGMFFGALGLAGFCTFGCSIGDRRKKTAKNAPFADIAGKMDKDEAEEAPEAEEGSGPLDSHFESTGPAFDEAAHDPDSSIEYLESATLFKHAYIPRAVRWLVPFVLVANLAMFVLGHVDVVMLTDVVAEVFGFPIQLDDFAELSVISTSEKLWEGEAYALATLLVGFSVIWPYIKLVGIAICWYTPVSRISFKRRGRVLVLLDQLGKWSLVELYFVAFCLVVLRVEVNSPLSLAQYGFEEIPAGLYRIAIDIDPQFNLYTFTTALLLSLFISNVVTIYQERIENRVLELRRIKLGQASADEERLSVHQYLFEKTGRNGVKYRIGVSRFAIALCVAAILSSVALVLYASSVPVLNINLIGLVRVLAELEGQPTEQPFDLFGFIRASFNMSSAGEAYFVMVFIFTVLVIPIAQQLMLIVIPLRSFTFKGAIRFLEINQVLSAWSATEVFVLSIAVSVLEIKSVTTFLVEDSCAVVVPIMNNVLLEAGIVTEEDVAASCFGMYATIERGTYIFFAALVLSNFAHLFMIKIFQGYVNSRKESMLAFDRHEPMVDVDDEEEEEELAEVSFTFRALAALRLLSITRPGATRAGPQTPGGSVVVPPV